jgi:hypothetical protein
MVLYWIAFAIEVAVAALIAGSIVRIVARRMHWARRRTQVVAYLLYWLVYLLGLLVPRSLRLHFLPHPFAEAWHTLGSDLFALFVMVALAQLAEQVAVIGLSTQAMPEGLENQLNRQ